MSYGRVRPFPQTLGTLKAGAEVVNVFAHFAVKVALKPALWLE